MCTIIFISYYLLFKRFYVYCACILYMYVYVCMYIYIHICIYIYIIYIQICVLYIHMYMHVRKYNDIVISEISAWGRPRDSPHHSERKRLKISQLCISAAEDLVALLHNTVQAPARGSPKGDPRVTQGSPWVPRVQVKSLRT